MIANARYMDGYNPGVELTLKLETEELNVLRLILGCEVERNLTTTADLAQEILDALSFSGGY